MFSKEVQQVPKKGPAPTGPLSVILNSDDTTFSHMRDLNFCAVDGFLSKKAKEISAAFQVGQEGGREEGRERVRGRKEIHREKEESNLSLRGAA